MSHAAAATLPGVIGRREAPGPSGGPLGAFPGPSGLDPSAPVLSLPERAVLNLIADGMPNARIGERLDLTRHEVGEMLPRIGRAIGAPDWRCRSVSPGYRAALTAAGYRSGALRPSPVPAAAPDVPPLLAAVLPAVAAHSSDDVAAAALGVSEGTVLSRVRRLMELFEVWNRAQLLRAAVDARVLLVPSLVLAPEFVGGVSPEGRRLLTDRQLEALRLVARGLTDHAIAAELGIKEGGARALMGRVMKILHAPSRANAVWQACGLGLLEPGAPDA